MKTILFAGGPFAGLIANASTIAQMPKDPDGTGTGFLLRLLGRDGALYTYHLKGNVCSLVSTIHSELSLEGVVVDDLQKDHIKDPETIKRRFDLYKQALGKVEVQSLLSDPRTFREKEDTP